MDEKKSIWDRVKIVVGAIKAAKILSSLFLLITSYIGYNEYTKPEPVEEVKVVDQVENLPLIVHAPQKDWLPIIRIEIEKAEEAHCIEHHGCR